MNGNWLLCIALLPLCHIIMSYPIFAALDTDDEVCKTMVNLCKSTCLFDILLVWALVTKNLQVWTRDDWFRYFLEVTCFIAGFLFYLLHAIGEQPICYNKIIWYQNYINWFFYTSVGLVGCSVFLLGLIGVIRKREEESNQPLLQVDLV